VVPNPRPFLDHDQWVKLRKLGKARISEPGLNPRTQRQRQELYWFMLTSVGAALRVGEAYSLRWRDCELITLNDKDKTEAVHMKVLTYRFRPSNFARTSAGVRKAPRHLCEQHHAQRDRRRSRSRHPLPQSVRVFNVEQVEGLSAQYTAPLSPRIDTSAPHRSCGAPFFSARRALGRQPHDLHGSQPCAARDGLHQRPQPAASAVASCSSFRG
jgi:hypothetical protein